MEPRCDFCGYHALGGPEFVYWIDLHYVRMPACYRCYARLSQAKSMAASGQPRYTDWPGWVHPAIMCRWPEQLVEAKEE